MNPNFQVSKTINPQIVSSVNLNLTSNNSGVVLQSATTQTSGVLVPYFQETKQPRGYVSSIYLDSSQAGAYSVAPTDITITGGGGSGASVSFSTGNIGGAYSITSIALTNGGSGYTSTPTINIIGGTIANLPFATGASFTLYMTYQEELVNTNSFEKTIECDSKLNLL